MLVIAVTNRIVAREYALIAIDLATGDSTPVGGNFTGPYTQGGVSATISQYDRCNLMFSKMIQTISQPLSSITYLVAVDMTTGALALSVANFNGWSLQYYNAPSTDGAIEQVE
jgi:hypothetical protein